MMALLLCLLMIVQLVPFTAVAEEVAVPTCDLGCNAATVGTHQDSCAVKVYYRDLFTANTPDALYAMKDQLPADAWEYILNVGWQLDNPKRMELDALLQGAAGVQGGEGATEAPGATEPAETELVVPAEDDGAEGIPACSGAPTCWGETNGDPMNNHVDTCARKAYLITFVQGNDAKSIAALWSGFSAEEQADIMSMVEAYTDYAEELKALVEGGSGDDDDDEEDVPSVSQTVNGKTVTVYSEGFPAGATLSVKETNVATQLEQFGLDEAIFAYDIKVLNEDSSQWQPDSGSGVVVKIPVDAPAGTKIGLLHTHNGVTTYQGLTAVQADGTVEIETNGFSAFVGFTVDFHYNGVDFSLDGMTSILLSELFAAMGINEDATQASGVAFSDSSLVQVTKEGNDWRLTSLGSFQTNETLIVTFVDGHRIVIDVTDPIHTDLTFNNNADVTGHFSHGVPGLYKFTVFLYNGDADSAFSQSNQVSGVPLSAWLDLTSNTYWFELRGTNGPVKVNSRPYDPLINVADKLNEHSIAFGGSGFGQNQIHVKCWPRRITNSSNSSYCYIMQAQKFADTNDKETRHVQIYVNRGGSNVLVQEVKNIVFPDRDGDANGHGDINAERDLSTPTGAPGYKYVSRDNVGTTYRVFMELIPYTVTYNLNGGSVSPANPTSYNVESAAFTLNNPTRTGYTFTGWTGTGLSSANKNVTIAKGSTGNRSYTANWSANNYTVTYNPYGGTVSSTTKSVTYDKAYGTLATPTRPGYIFDGWYTAASGGTKITADTVYKTAGDSTIYAHWTPITYSVSFNGNGATGGSMSNQSFTFNAEAKALTANGFERKYTVTFNGNGGSAATASAVANATFNGWEDRGSIVHNGVTYSYEDFDAPYYVKMNNDLYEAFGNNKYSLINHYVGWGKGEGRKPAGDEPMLWKDQEVVANMTTTNGYTVPLYANWTLGKVTLPNATRDGYRFLGWYTAAEGGIKVGDAGAEYEPKANIPLYAHWEQNPHTVTASVSSNGTATPATQSVKHGESGTVTFTANTGYKIDYIMDGTTEVDISDADSYTYTVSNVTADRTVVAYTVADTYPVTYNANGGSGAPAAQTKTYNVPLTLSSDEPIRAGYDFTGWNTKADGSGTDYAPGDLYTGNASLTLYAQWDPKQYTITYDANGGSKVDPQTYDIEDNVALAPASTKEGYDFTGWKLSSAVNTWQAKTYGAQENVGTGKYGNITLVAQWDANKYPVTFHHYLEGTTTELYDDTTANIAYGTKVNVADYAQTIPNYAVASCAPTQLEVKVSGNVATIYYKPLTAAYTVKVYKQQVTGDGYDVTVDSSKVGNIGATVNANPTDYVETGFTFVVGKSTASGEIMADGGLVLELYFDRVLYKVTYEYTGTVPEGAPAVPALKEYRYGATATVEEAPSLTGYDFNGWSEKGDFLVYDHMTFTGEWIAKTDAWYLVHYYLDGTETKLLDDERVDSKTYGESYEETAPVIPGYTPVKNSESVTAGYKDNEVTFYYKPNTDTAYKVEHYLRQYGNATPELKDTVPMTGTTGEETKAEAKEYPGYTAADFEQAEIAGDGSTVVKIYYDEQPVTVNYHSENEAYGTVNPAAEGPVGAATGEISGSVPTAKDGFKFVGWYEDSACTKPVDSSLVDAETNKLTPAKVDGLNVSAAYYAKFAPVETKITVVMHVDGKYANLEMPFTGTLNWDHHEGSPQTETSEAYELKNGESTTVTIQAGSTFYLSDMMPPDTYTFVEAVYGDVRETGLSGGKVENDGFVLTEGDCELHIYYKSKDVTETGLYLGNAGAIAAILAVCAGLIVIYVIGRRRRRNEE